MMIIIKLFVLVNIIILVPTCMRQVYTPYLSTVVPQEELSAQRRVCIMSMIVGVD